MSSTFHLNAAPIRVVGDESIYFILSNTPQLCCGDEHITNKQLLCSRILGQYFAV